MPLVPGQLITAPEPGLPRYGLFRVASGPLDMPGPHAEGGGLRYVPTVCGPSHAVGIDCPDPGDLPDPDGDNGEITTGSFLVRSALECTQVGQTEAEMLTKVTRRLEASEQGTVERSFATGEDFAASPLDILNLDGAAEDADLPYDPTDLRSVVGALLAQGAADYGSRLTLHAPASAEPYATDAGLVVQDGPVLRTPSGALWSFGNYPAGTIYASGAVTIWRSPEIAAYSTFDTTSNLRLVVAERAYAIGIDCGFVTSADFIPLAS